MKALLFLLKLNKYAVRFVTKCYNHIAFYNIGWSEDLARKYV